MNLILAKEIGFCYGVRDAIKKINQFQNQQQQSIDIYGELIHNQESINELKAANASPLNIIHDLNDVQSTSVAIRAHGAGPSVYKFLEERNLNIIDTTCPFVIKTQNIGKKLIEEAYFVFILGKKMHPEVLAIEEHLRPNCLVIENLDDFENNKISAKKAAIIFQSTVTINDFSSIILKIINQFSEIKIKSTICDITTKRQIEILSLIEKVDHMLVVGGKNSSNTKKLFQISQEKIPSFHIENEKDLHSILFEDIKNLGLITGTSTSAKLVDKIIQMILKLVPNTKILKHSEI